MTTHRMALAVVLLLLVLLAIPTVTTALSASPVSELRIEWEQISRGGRPVVRGYVYNQHQMRAENIILRVEQLDAQAQPVAARITYVAGTVPYRDRGYFEVSVPAAGATYRVSVQSFDRSGCGNG